MKRLVTALAAFAMVTPSVAFAGPVAQSLSLSNAVVSPVRASTTTGKKLKMDGENDTLLIVAAVVIAAGIACLIWCDGSDTV